MIELSLKGPKTSVQQFTKIISESIKGVKPGDSKIYAAINVHCKPQGDEYQVCQVKSALYEEGETMIHNDEQLLTKSQLQAVDRIKRAFIAIQMDEIEVVAYCFQPGYFATFNLEMRQSKDYVFFYKNEEYWARVDIIGQFEGITLMKLSESKVQIACIQDEDISIIEQALYDLIKHQEVTLFKAGKPMRMQKANYLNMVNGYISLASNSMTSIAGGSLVFKGDTIIGFTVSDARCIMWHNMGRYRKNIRHSIANPLGGKGYPIPHIGLLLLEVNKEGYLSKVEMNEIIVGFQTIEEIFVFCGQKNAKLPIKSLQEKEKITIEESEECLIVQEVEFALQFAKESKLKEINCKNEEQVAQQELLNAKDKQQQVNEVAKSALDFAMRMTKKAEAELEKAIKRSKKAGEDSDSADMKAKHLVQAYKQIVLAKKEQQQREKMEQEDGWIVGGEGIN